MPVPRSSALVCRLSVHIHTSKLINLRLCISLTVGSGSPAAHHLQVMMLTGTQSFSPKITASVNHAENCWVMGHFGGALGSQTLLRSAARLPCYRGNHGTSWNRLLWIRSDWKRWWFVALFCLLNSVCGFHSRSYSNTRLLLFCSIFTVNCEQLIYGY